MTRTILFCCTVWPEPRSSAAGVRTRFLIESVRRLRPDWKVVVHSVARDTDYRRELEEELGIECATFLPNDPAFDAFVQERAPSAVVFDRFMTEEQFGWRVRENAPVALRLLDTSDLHFLRRAREAESRRTGEESLEITPAALIGEARRDFYRELASILRCDRAWVVSSHERDLLLGLPDFPASKASLLRWGVDPVETRMRAFEERTHFAMIGNFRHPPNADSVHWVRREIWPLIRRAMPGAEVHVYGAYPRAEDMALESPTEGFHVHGPWSGDAREVLSKYRVLLAPLRFGAGIKGKILDAWAAGTAVVTTPTGAEGIVEEGPFPGTVAAGAAAFAEAAVRTHEDAIAWSRLREEAAASLLREYSGVFWSARLIEEIEALLRARESGEAPHWITELLHEDERHSKRHLSRYIELKTSLVLTGR